MCFRKGPCGILMMVRMRAVVRMAIVLENNPGKQKGSGEGDPGAYPVHQGYPLFGVIMTDMKHKLTEQDQGDTDQIERKQPVVSVPKPRWKKSRHAQRNHRNDQQSLDGF